MGRGSGPDRRRGSPRVVPPPAPAAACAPAAARVRNGRRGSRAGGGGGGGGGATAQARSGAVPGAEGVGAVLAAVGSLYDDQLKPYGRILRKRLAERVEEGVCAPTPLCTDAAGLRAVCEANVWLTVLEEDGGEWSAVLAGREQAFIDIYSPFDVYPDEFWQAAAHYFESVPDELAELPGGRYACARTLAARNLPFLYGYSLGQLCHIVQLAISQRKMLGYLSGSVVPYSRSQSKVKDTCALLRQVPCESALPAPLAEGGAALATWDIVRTCVSDLLVDAAATGNGSVPLSNIKRLFRTRCDAELSETALGHPKLSELLQDPRMQGVCALHLESHGYVVTSPWKPCESAWECEASALAAPRRRAVQVCLADRIPDERHVSAPVVVEQAEAAPLEAAGFVEARRPSGSPALHETWPYAVRNTFIDAGRPPPPEGAARRRSLSSPKDLWSKRDDLGATCHALRYRHAPVAKGGDTPEAACSTAATSELATEPACSECSDAWGECSEDQYVDARERGPMRGNNL